MRKKDPSQSAQHLNGRLVVLAFVVFVLLAPSLAACAGRPADITTTIGQIAVIAPGQSVAITDESLKLRLIEVVNDSRCPKGATCIWAGQVSCLVEVTYQNQINSIVLTQGGSGQAETDFMAYHILFDVQPYPELNKAIKPADYKLQLTVTKVPELSGGILATFQVIDEQYSIFVTNKAAIEQILALQRGESSANIPNGRLHKGALSYNKPWSWYIDSEEINMAEVTIELSDGKPSQVEDNLDYWIDTVRYFSPWSAQLIEVKDFR